MSAVPVIAIDGPGGSGKGTLSRALAAKLGWHLLDSGALYRLLAIAAGEAGVTAPAQLEALARRLQVDFGDDGRGGERIRLAGRDVSLNVRAEATGARASELAVIPEVRAGLKDLQRSFLKAPGLVADGRDMGTVIFPEARLKVFLTASARERAQRRYNQLIEKGLTANLDALFRDISSRDERDQTRAVSPLKAAPDAVTLDTTGVPIERVVEQVLELAGRRFGVRSGG